MRRFINDQILVSSPLRAIIAPHQSSRTIAAATRPIASLMWRSDCSAITFLPRRSVADIARDLGMSPADAYRFFAFKSASRLAAFYDEMPLFPDAYYAGAGISGRKLIANRFLSEDIKAPKV